MRDASRRRPVSRSRTVHEASEIVARAPARDEHQDTEQDHRADRRQREERVPHARHCQAPHREERDQSRHDDADHGERQAFERNRRRRHLGRDAVVEQDDLQRVAGDAAHGEEADRVGGEPHAKEARERGTGIVGKGDGPAPRAQQVPDGAGKQDDRQREAEALRAVNRFVEVDVEEGENEQQDADGDRRHRHDLGDRSGQVPLLLLVLGIVGVGIGAPRWPCPRRPRRLPPASWRASSRSASLSSRSSTA